MPQLPNDADLDRMYRHTQLCLRAEGPVHRYIQRPPREKHLPLLAAARLLMLRLHLGLRHGTPNLALTATVNVPS